jgi:Fe-S cluster biogenesis protein NfuA
LIADLAAALDKVVKAGAARPPLSEPAERSPADSDLSAAVVAAVERSVASTIIARGGSVRVVSVEGGVVTLEAGGSPGAIVPTIARIEGLLRAAVPEVSEVNVVWPGALSPPASAADDLAARVRRVLDEEVNRAVAGHRGHVTLVDITGGHVRVRMEGGCQGCSLAEVTLRQGIEPLLRKHVPEVTAVIDVTDHAAATAPFFAPGKR